MLGASIHTTTFPEEGAIGSPKGAHAVAFWAVLLAGVVLRITGLEVQSFWLDEGFTLSVATASDPLEVLRLESNPPVFFYLLRAVLPTLDALDLSPRLLPALLGCLAMVCFAGIACSLLSSRASLVAMGLYALSPFLIWYSRELRAYSAIEAGSLLLVFLYLRSQRSGWSLWTITTALVTSVLLLGTHYYGLLVLSGLFFFHLLCRRNTPGYRSGAGVLVGVGVASVATWTYWLMEYLPQQMAQPWGAQAKRSLIDLLQLPTRLLLFELARMPLIVLGVFAIALAATLASGLWAGFRNRSSTVAFAIALLLGPIAVVFVGSFFIEPRFMPRYLIASVSGLCLLAGLGVDCIINPYLRVGLVVALIGGEIRGLAPVVLTNVMEDYRAVAHEVQKNWREGEALVVVTGMQGELALASFEHYWKRDSPIAKTAQPFGGDPAAGAELLTTPGRVHVIMRRRSYTEAQVKWVLENLRAEGEPFRARGFLYLRGRFARSGE